ncbi:MULTISPECIES: xylulokinase [Rodentibacter]|uniref:xylulokinase n=1 Tax=Rodentibacter TaxID=1960084 RepID=UPI001CFDEE90|nr:xylulokinase [Rodentibacter sp. JRC1]GJI56218.1 xylulose kinase [Rodentibacter sp. JRC1]
MYIGIDCGTQGTKAIVVDRKQKKVIGRGYASHQLIEQSNGRREQHPNWWIDAFQCALNEALKQAKILPHLVKGIGISGQQHGLVMLDKNDQPLYNAKLWCDTETVNENAELIERLGGQDLAFAKLGIMCQTGYTASKLCWFRQYYPDQFRQIHKIMLPHDYLNYWLTGHFCTEFGDASGTGYFDIVNRCWSRKVFGEIAPELNMNNVLPTLLSAEQKIGVIKPEIAKFFGFNQDVIVSTGSGDNMMGAIGTGNIKEGIVTMSLGTSGTLYAYTKKPLPNLSPMIANFCSANNGWLPLICVMNMTSSNKQLMKLFNIDVPTFNHLAQQSPIGASGITILPFFNGERVPPLPNAKARILGVDSSNFTRENLCRAMMESATFTLRYGLDLFRRAGLTTSQIRLIGGGSKSTLWRQIIANVMNTEVVCLLEEEAAALGGAIQAMWANGEGELKSLCHEFVHLDESLTCSPNKEAVDAYEAVYLRYLSHLNSIN